MQESVTASQLIDRLRAQLTRCEAFAFYGMLSDPHLSEYAPDYYKFVSALTGFTGSNAKVLVTHNEIRLWTDSRYWEQAGIECEKLGVILMKEGTEDVPEASEFLKDVRGDKATRILIPLHMTPYRVYEAFVEKGFTVIDMDDAVIDTLWTQRPALTKNALWIHEASKNEARGRLLTLQKAIKDYAQSHAKEEDHGKGKNKAPALILNKLDQIAWLTALRGSDIAYNPFFLARAIITRDEATLFVACDNLTESVSEHLKAAGWRLDRYDAFEEAVKNLSGGSILFNPAEMTARLVTVIENVTKHNPEISAVHFEHGIDLAKAVKNEAEIRGLEEVAFKDSRAVDAFIAEVRARLDAGEVLTECDLADILHAHRAKIPGFISESFETIAAIDANAAQPHYAPTKDKAASVKMPCVLLVDSGAQYDKGTTDITRVWLLGETSDMDPEKLAMLKADYKAVYRAMRALENARFKPGACGFDLDSIARDEVKMRDIDYGHSTGHGIGLTLGVHEAPPSISPRETPSSKTPLVPGMVVSDEPGIYRTGLWGIRLENMLLCVEKEDGLLGFETLTDCGFDERLLAD